MTAPADALGVAHLTALELPPGDLVRGASKAGFRSVGLRVHPATPGGPAYPTVVGTKPHEALRSILGGEGMRLNDIEFVPITPGIDIPSLAGLLEAGADLGATSVTVSGDDEDVVRLTANFAALCDLAAGFGLRVDIEFMRWRAVGNLKQAASIVMGAGKPNGAILVDALHLSRSGGAPADLHGFPAALLRSVQLCDAPAGLPETDEAVIAEAREGRLPPGEGALPLRDLLAAVPKDVALSVEMPMPRLNATERLHRAYRSTKRVLSA